MPDDDVATVSRDASGRRDDGRHAQLATSSDGVVWEPFDLPSSIRIGDPPLTAGDRAVYAGSGLAVLLVHRLPLKPLPPGGPIAATLEAD